MQSTLQGARQRLPGSRSFHQQLRRAVAGLGAAALGLGLAVGTVPLTAQAAPGEVNGQVFRDYNSNGVFDTDGLVETGIADVEVRAFDTAGDEVGSATTDADGSYSLNYDTGDDSTDVRVEFIPPSGMVPTRVAVGEAQAGSTVQFVSGGEQANLGLAYPGDFSSDDTLLATAVQRGVIDTRGSRTPTDQASVITFGAAETGDAARDTTNGTTEAMISQTGSVWGTATVGDEFILSSAFLKRGTAVGPGGLGQIYLTEVGGDPDAEPFVTIPNVGDDPRPDGAADPDSDYDWFHDSVVYPEIGKVGLGAITMSPDETTLYAVNLNDKQLYTVPIERGPDGAPVAGEPVAEPIPTPTGCDAEWSRPFGVHATAENVLVASTCTGPTEGDLNGAIFQRGVDDAAFSDEPVLTVPYGGLERALAGLGTAGGIITPIPETSANVVPWDSDFMTRDGVGLPQMLISSIDFDPDGAMLVGVKDRFGDQSGYYLGNPDDEGSTDRYLSVAAGDILRACGSLDEGYVLEDNGSCGGATGSGADNGQGHGGGEFYNDDFEQGFPTVVHNQSALGAVLQLPGREDAVATAYDPRNAVYTNGVRRLSHADGSDSAGNNLELVGPMATDLSMTPELNPNGNFGKAGGLGDLDALVSDPVEIGNRVWIDTDDDGVQDAGEAPVADATVTLTCGDLTAETTTDDQGEYYFNDENVEGGLPADLECSVTVDPAGTDAEGYQLTQQDAGDGDHIDSDATAGDGATAVIEVTTPTNGADHTYDVGFVPAQQECSLGDYIWVDVNENGIQDDGEDPVADVTVTLLDADGNPVEGVEPVVTDENGNYLFEGIPCGSYRVEFSDIPDDHEFTTPNTGDNEGTDSDAVPADDDPTVGITEPVVIGGDEPEQNLDVDAGLVPTGEPPVEQCSVGDFVWFDANSNGLQDDGEGPVADVTVELINADGDTVDTTTTDDQGVYHFDNLECGDYTIRFSDTPDGYVFTTQQTGDDSGADSNPNADGLTPVFTLGADAEDNRESTPDDGVEAPVINPTIDAGLIEPPANACSVGDFVWVDSNGNGLQDEGEEPVADVTVELIGSDGETVSTTATDDRGVYHFDNVECGDYTIRFSDLPDGAEFTEQTVGEDSAVDSNPDAEGVTDRFTLGDGAEDNRESTPDDGVEAPVINPTIDAGIVLSPDVCVIGDYVWFDENGNGVQDEGEQPAPGVEVILVDPDGNPVEGVDPVVTGEDGGYRFEVPCGEYRIEVIPPEGSEVTEPGQGDDPARDSDADPETGLTPPIGVGGDDPNEDLTVDIGLVPAADVCSVGDFVWVDSNGNGLQDEGEEPAPGVAVILLDPEGDPVEGVDPAVTDEDGGYRFTVPCGEYRVEFTELPEGSTLTQPGAGDDPAADSNPDPDTGITELIVVGGDQPNIDQTIDAGLIPAGDEPVLGDTGARAGLLTLAGLGAAALVAGAGLLVRRRMA